MSDFPDFGDGYDSDKREELEGSGDPQATKGGTGKPNPLLTGLLIVIAVLGLGAIFVRIFHPSVKLESNAVFVDFRSDSSCRSVSDSCAVARNDVVSTYRDASACSAPGKRVCIVPVGAVTLDLISYLRQQLADELGMPVQVLPPIDVPPDAYDSQRHQFSADRILHTVEGLYASKAGKTGSLLVAITPDDIFIPDRPTWAFGFGQRELLNSGVVAAVVSTYEMVDPELIPFTN